MSNYRVFTELPFFVSPLAFFSEHPGFVLFQLLIYVSTVLAEFRLSLLGLLVIGLTKVVF